MKKILMGAAAVLLALGGVTVSAEMASAHNLDLQGQATCAAGVVTVTWTGDTTNVPDNDAAGVVTVKSHTPPTSTLDKDSVQVNGNSSFTIVQSDIAGDFNGNVNINLDIDWPNFSQHDVTGHVKLDGSCVPPPPPVDVCKNLDGAQATIPAGLIDDGNGNCITPPVDVCANIDGVQTTVPEGLVQDGANCVTPPVEAITCTWSGDWYTEGDDHAPVASDAGLQFTSAHDGHATGYLHPVNGNLQGISNITYTDENIAGNGIFFRFVVDLTGDGGGAYNSFSITSQPIGQSSIADVGSKSVFLGKTIAQVAAQYPHNKIVAEGFQTGSSYTAGDGALLTSVSGDCGSANFVKPPVVTPPVTTPVVDTQLPATPVLAETGVNDAPALAIAGGMLVAGAVCLIAIPMLRRRRQQ